VIRKSRLWVDRYVPVIKYGGANSRTVSKAPHHPNDLLSWSWAHHDPMTPPGKASWWGSFSCTTKLFVVL
jgi:hypothetical protein